MDFFPLFVNVKDKNIYVVGGGTVAYRKTKTLLECGAKVLVIAREIKDERFYDLVEEYNKNSTCTRDNKINIKEEDFDLPMFEKSRFIGEAYFMVIAATDDEALNEKIYKICDKLNVLVNNATSKEKMNARFASIIDGKDFTIAISGKGDPKKAKDIKEKLEIILKENDLSSEIKIEKNRCEDLSDIS